MGRKKTIIHVNQHHIRTNRKNEREGNIGEPVLPVLTCKTYNTNEYGHEAVLKVDGKEIGRFVYQPEKPLSCGARVWFEFYSDVVDLEVIQKDKA